MSSKELLPTNRQKVWEAFEKSEKDVLKDVEILKTWLKTQPHLPEIPNDAMIESFLATNKFSIERTKEKLDNYYSLRPLLPEIFENSNPNLPHMQEISKSVMFVPLPKLTKDLFRVNVMKVIGDPEDFDSYKVMGYQFGINEVRLQEDLALGDISIIDYEFLKMGHVSKMSLMHMKKGAIVLEKILSIRLKGIYLINYPPYVNILINLGKMVLKPKLMDRLRQLSTLEDLHKLVPKEILPKDYGGDELPLQELHDLWKKKLVTYKDRFDKLDQMAAKEELRPAPLKNDDLLGYHGNFKKLDVD